MEPIKVFLIGVSAVAVGAIATAAVFGVKWHKLKDQQGSGAAGSTVQNGSNGGTFRSIGKKVCEFFKLYGNEFGSCNPIRLDFLGNSCSSGVDNLFTFYLNSEGEIELGDHPSCGAVQCGLSDAIKILKRVDSVNFTLSNVSKDTLKRALDELNEKGPSNFPVMRVTEGIYRKFDKSSGRYILDNESKSDNFPLTEYDAGSILREADEVDGYFSKISKEEFRKKLEEVLSYANCYNEIVAMCNFYLGTYMLPGGGDYFESISRHNPKLVEGVYNYVGERWVKYRNRFGDFQHFHEACREKISRGIMNGSPGEAAANIDKLKSKLAELDELTEKAKSQAK